MKPLTPTDLKTRQQLVHRIMVVIIPVSFFCLFLVDPYPQDKAYHNFADDRGFLGIPNFWNVLTNIPFLVVGLLGIVHWVKKRPTAAPRSWLMFFVGVALVSIGSAYYHLEPGNSTLFWDRLPMTIAFMSLTMAVMAEFLHPAHDRFGLPFALAVGITAISWWAYADDLRFYGWVQFAPMLFLPMILIMVHKGESQNKWLWFGFLAYLLAKVAEYFDPQIYNLTFEIFSGHSLKHLLAALCCLFVYFKLNPPGETIRSTEA